MKQFNDAVSYIRGGKSIPAIVLSSLASAKGELLTLLYAQPDMGPVLLAQGTTRGIAQVQQAVEPMVEGKAFGWQEAVEEAPAVNKDNLFIQGYASDHIWTMEDKPGFIGLRLDCGDAGTVYFTPDQAKQVVDQFGVHLETVNPLEAELATANAEIETLKSQLNDTLSDHLTLGQSAEVTKHELDAAKAEVESLHGKIIEMEAILNQKPEPAPAEPPAESAPAPEPESEPKPPTEG